MTPADRRPAWAKNPELGLPVEEREPGSEASLGPAEIEVDAPFEAEFGADFEAGDDEEAVRAAEASLVREEAPVREEVPVPVAPSALSLRERLQPSRFGVVLGCLLVAALLLYWVPALRLGEADLEEMGGLGLISMLPVPTLVGAGCSSRRSPRCGSAGSTRRCCWCAARDHRVAARAARGARDRARGRRRPGSTTGSWSTSTAPGPPYRDLDARFSWPGFFAVAAFVTRACGMTTSPTSSAGGR